MGKKKKFQKWKNRCAKKWEGRQQLAGTCHPFVAQVLKPMETVGLNGFDQLSGIDYDPETGLLWMIEDDVAVLTAFDFEEKEIVEEIEIEQGEDFEDVCVVGSSVYVLCSSGMVLEYCKNKRNWHEWDNDFDDDEIEFEGLCYDPNEERKCLLMACKYNQGDEQAKKVLLFDLTTHKAELDFEVKLSDIEKLLDFDKFNPSGIQVIDNLVYLIASAGQLMVVTDRKGAVVSAVHLSREPYLQPEGICLYHDYLLIANEGRGKEGGPGNGSIIKIAKST